MKQKHFGWMLRFSSVPILIIMLSVFIRTESRPVFASTTNPNCTQTLGPWVQAASSPANHIEGGTAAVNGKMYLFTGFADNSLTPANRLDVYNPETNVWETVAQPRAPMPIAASHIQAAVDGQYVWLAGGFVGRHPGPPTNQVWRYDTVTDMWAAGPPLPAPRASGALVVNGRNLHYIGGLSTNRNTDYSTHWVLNLDNLPAGWRTAAPLPSPRNHFNGVVIDGIIYVSGGQFRHDNNPQDVALVHAYNSLTNTWVQKASMPTPRSHAEPGMFLMNDRIVVVGGRNNPGGQATMSSVVQYNPQTNTWQSLRSLPGSLIGPAAEVIGNKVIVTNGGIAYNVGQQNTWVSQVETNCVLNPTPTPSNTPPPASATSPSGQAINSLTLVNADTDQDIAPLTNGMVISFEQIGTRNLSVRANTFPSSIGSVRFALDDNANFRTENSAPYTLNGDSNGGSDYAPWTPTLGTHTLTAIPYTQGNGQGTMGLSMSVTFTVVETLPTPTPSWTPTFTPSATPSLVPTEIPAYTPVYRINAGGPAVTTSGITWSADQYFTGDGQANTFVTDITGTEDDVLYHDERSSTSSSAGFAYQLPVANGVYTVRLHFAEVWFSDISGRGSVGQGQRVFDVQMESASVLTNFDITAEMGPLAAVVKSFDVTVSDGLLDLVFPPALADRPTIAAIEVLQLVPPTPTATPTETPTETPSVTPSLTPTLTPSYTPTFTPTQTPVPTPVVFYRINAGGPAVTSSGVAWSADQAFTGNGKANTFISPIAGTEDDALYQDERSSTANSAGFAYQLPLPNGTYSVRLHFAELWFTGVNGRGPVGTGRRIFNVQMENATVLSNFDITAQAGALTALVRSFDVTVSDGVLNIVFPPAQADRPTIAAIEVVQQVAPQGAGVPAAPVIVAPTGAPTTVQTVPTLGSPATAAPIVGTPALPPIASAGDDQTVVDANGDGAEAVVLNGLRSVDADGDGMITYASWQVNGMEIATGLNPTVILPLGVHTLTLIVFDVGGLSAVDTVTITVSAPGG
ncbi:MAG: malectin domain-containing carbohydrate-binding protein [bacterium]|nr:malectin domain-containing carbohydrate-binding protein [bacterium]